MIERSIPDMLRMAEHTASDTRARRVDALNEKVDALFEGEHHRELRERIQRSFLVPQWGAYHTEGVFMDSHLSLILANIDDIAAGRFPMELSPQAREAMTRTIARDRTAVERYVFLHDISKADCLTLKFESIEDARAAGLTDAPSPNVPVGWEEYQALLNAHPDGRKALEGDEAAFSRWAQMHKLSGVSYFHPDSKHGDAGSQWLQQQAADTDAVMLTAIERHEDAYQFQKVDAERYLLSYADIGPEGRDFALLASYVDTAASLRTDGKPDLANFLALAASKEKAELVPRLVMELGASAADVDTAMRTFIKHRLEGTNNPREPLVRLFKDTAGEALDKTKAAKFLETLFFGEEAARMEDMPALLERIASECKRASYDRAKLEQGVQTLVDETFTSQDASALVELIVADPDAVGKTFGKKLGRKMGQLKHILEGAKE